MKLFTINYDKLKSISSTDFRLEKDIQNLVEKNLEELFHLQFVKSEVKIKNFRVDTLGFNKETKSFVIIEYKKDIHRPYYLKIHWGTLLFKCVLTNLDIEYKLFNPDGTPIRAIARCTFTGTVEEDLRKALENKQSPDVTHERIVKSGDRLSLMTHKIYNQQNHLPQVAAFNKLDGFRNIKTGTKIYFPPVEK